MLFIITGGSGSGKSAYAEKMAVDLHNSDRVGGGLYYVATMYPYDAECDKRIEKHRKMRRNKGFTTIECYHHLEQVQVGRDAVVLLECMSNLLANEMYLEQGRIKNRDRQAEEQMREAILEPVFGLTQQAGAVVIMTNEVFSDGMTYDAETMCYIRLLARINRELAARAGSVTEVVCGIPLCRKGDRQC